MSVLRIVPGQSLLGAPGRLALLAPLAGAAAGSNSPTVTYPSAIAGLSGRWELGTVGAELLYGRPKDAERQHPAVVSDRRSTKP